MASDRIISFNDVLEANKRISQFLHKTPVFTSHQADEKSGGRCIFFKAENLQKSGSFKARGALNAVLKCRESNNATCGVVTHSSGNHGQGLAWAASVAKLPCYVVVPQMAPLVKKNAILSYGAELVECGAKPTDRYEACDRLEKDKNLVFIPPYDHQDVIAGQGTIGLEFLEQVPQLDAILIPVSGGGMSAGIAIAAKTIKPDIKIFLVTPKGKKLEECLTTGKRPWEGPPQYLETIADGIRLQQTGYITTPILIDLVEKQVFEMSDQEMVEGMKFAFERMKLVIEAASGAAVAAAFSQKMKNMDASIQNVGVILCGGNVDIDDLPW
ncbi:amino acid racemase [Biomphalaria pfeifferi]|uniref:Serine racemase n=1 Tax=Biomphalaria pfeifferi TaxID=112525 RepID=A0AAD8CAB1_BIOPF|nr:amino acid racemase [Biomphalaria pfeifferi]